jgi:DNA-binding NarL/FixJ family response regulator
MITSDTEPTSLEKLVLRDLAYGLTSPEIAEKHDLSVTVVTRSVNELSAKLGATTRQSLLVKAFVRGYIDESAFDAGLTGKVARNSVRSTSCFP